MTRRTDPVTPAKIRDAGGARVLTRGDGALLALFESPYWLQRLEADHPDWCLEPILTDETAQP